MLIFREWVKTEQGKGKINKAYTEVCEAATAFIEVSLNSNHLQRHLCQHTANFVLFFLSSVLWWGFAGLIFNKNIELNDWISKKFKWTSELRPFVASCFDVNQDPVEDPTLTYNGLLLLIVTWVKSFIIGIEMTNMRVQGNRLDFL